MKNYVMTVLGPVIADEIGLTLPHEHILVDFISADEVKPGRYDSAEVRMIMLPYLEEIKDRGVQTFVECTPMYLARDPMILRALAEDTGLNILTNTGQYKEPHLPAETFEISAEALAESWIDEVENGIGDTGIRPGFIKTAVNFAGLSSAQQKVITAAAITCKNTGLTIATHTGVASAAFEVLSILESVGADPAKWIFVHAQNEADMDRLLDVAKTGAWISLDNLSDASAERHLNSLRVLLDAGFEDRVLLSHDAGWYHVGEERGGEVRPYTYLCDAFLPNALESGIPADTLELITAKNPGAAYSIG